MHQVRWGRVRVEAILIARTARSTRSRIACKSNARLGPSGSQPLGDPDGTADDA